MSFHPLAQTSGVAFPVPETTTIPSAEGQSEYNPSLSGPSPQQQAKNKRRPSKDNKASTAIRRSSSTPHMRNLALGTAGDLSPTGDKRRNKLGYHRTSVACGHCRRRKIRCLVANDEPTGRCANCIRLKKECNFYPVDQTPETQRSQGGAPKETSTGGHSSSATSSPRHPPSMSGEKVDEFRTPLHGMPLNPASRYGMHGDSEVDPHHVPSSGGLPVQHPSYGYPHPIDTQWPPATGFLPSSSVAESPSSSTGYWRPSPSTANSNYGKNHAWGPSGFQPPTRSMSYGNIEGLPQQYSNQGLGIQQADYPRRTSPYPYPSTIDTYHPNIHATTLGSNTSAPLSAPIVPNHQYTYPPPWNPYSGGPAPGHEMPVQSRSMSAQWYGEPGQLDQVQEEGGPSMTFSPHGMQQFYSGP